MLCTTGTAEAVSDPQSRARLSVHRTGQGAQLTCNPEGALHCRIFLPIVQVSSKGKARTAFHGNSLWERAWPPLAGIPATKACR